MNAPLNVVRAVLILLAAGAAARAQDAPADPLATAQAVRSQLDQLRVVEANNPQRVLDLLKRNYTVRNPQFVPIQALANGFLFDFLIASFGDQW